MAEVHDHSQHCLPGIDNCEAKLCYLLGEYRSAPAAVATGQSIDDGGMPIR